MQLQYEIDKKAIGKRLQNERLRQYLTQEKLSEAIGVTTKYLSKVENGAAAPSLPFIIKFSEVTGSDLNYLLRGTDQKIERYPNMVREETLIYDAFDNGLSRKSRKVCSEIMMKVIEVLEENKI